MSNHEADKYDSRSPQSFKYQLNSQFRSKHSSQVLITQPYRATVVLRDWFGYALKPGRQHMCNSSTKRGVGTLHYVWVWTWIHACTILHASVTRYINVPRCRMVLGTRNIRKAKFRDVVLKCAKRTRKERGYFKNKPSYEYLLNLAHFKA